MDKGLKGYLEALKSSSDAELLGRMAYGSDRDRYWASEEIAKRATEEAERYARGMQDQARQLDSTEERERLKDRTRDYLDRARLRTEARPNDSSQFEAQLEKTLRMLEDQRNELDRLREEIEDLRAQPRRFDPTPRTDPGGAGSRGRP